jgi:hypothetical protein
VQVLNVKCRQADRIDELCQRAVKSTTLEWTTGGHEPRDVEVTPSGR